MTGQSTTREAAATRAAVPSCALNDEELERQRDRQRRLAPSVAAVGRDGDALRIRFARGFASDALDEMLAVERECCPFFRFDFDERSRELRVGVDDPEHEPALEALTAALRPAG